SQILEKRFDGTPEDACLGRLGENSMQCLIMLALAHPMVLGLPRKTYDTILRYYRQDVPSRSPSGTEWGRSGDGVGTDSRCSTHHLTSRLAALPICRAM